LHDGLRRGEHRNDARRDGFQGETVE